MKWKSLIVGLLVTLVVPLGLVGCGGSKQEFCYEKISVVLENDVSLKMVRDSFRVTPEYFSPDFVLAEVEHLSILSEENVRRQIVYGEHFDDMIDPSTFRISLLITLYYPGHQNVLDAVALMNERYDVYGASVIGFVKPQGHMRKKAVLP